MTAKQKEALSLLGEGVSISGGKGRNMAATLANIRTVKLCLAKGLPEGWPEAVRRTAKELPDTVFLELTVSKHPDISAVRQVLGPEDGTEPDPRASSSGFGQPHESTPIDTWYKYDWLHFGTRDGRVMVIRGDCRGFRRGSPPVRPSATKPAEGPVARRSLVQRATLKGHGDRFVETAAFSPDGRVVATAGDDHAIILWDTATGKLKQRVPIQRPASAGKYWTIPVLRFSPDGTLLAAGLRWDHSAHGSVAILDALEGKPVRTLTADKEECPYALCFSPDGGALLVGYNDGAAGSHAYDPHVAIWDHQAAKRKSTFGAEGRLFASIWMICAGPDGRSFATAGLGDLQVWDIPGRVRKWRKDRPFVKAFVYGAGGRDLIVFEDTSFSLRLISVATGEDRRHWGIEQAPRLVDGCAFSPDGALLAAGNVNLHEHGTIWIWDVASGRLVASAKGHLNRIRSLVFSADSKMLVSCGYDQTAILWDVREGRK